MKKLNLSIIALIFATLCFTPALQAKKSKASVYKIDNRQCELEEVCDSIETCVDDSCWAEQHCWDQKVCLVDIPNHT